MPFPFGLVTSQVLVSLLLLSLNSQRSAHLNSQRSAQQCIYGALLIAVVIQETAYYRAMVVVETAILGLFLLFCVSLFDDHYRFRFWQVALLLPGVALARMRTTQNC